VRRDETAALVGSVEGADPEADPVLEVPEPVPVEERLATVEVVTGSELAVGNPDLMLVPVVVSG